MVRRILLYIGLRTCAHVQRFSTPTLSRASKSEGGVWFVRKSAVRANGQRGRWRTGNEFATYQRGFQGRAADMVCEARQFWRRLGAEVFAIWM